MNRKILLMLIILTILINLTFAQEEESYDEVLLVNNYSGAKYQSRILTELNKTAEVQIIVKIKDTSGIVITSEDSEEEQGIKDSMKKEILENKTNAVLSTLPQNEFKLKGKFPKGDGFYGTVTKEGFEILVNNSDVGEIFLEIIAHTTPVNTIDKGQEVKEPQHEVIKNDSTLKNFSIFGEGKSEIPNKVSEVEKVKTAERKNQLWLLTSIFVFILLISIYLLIKFRRR